jgi:hypothetical protein
MSFLKLYSPFLCGFYDSEEIQATQNNDESSSSNDMVAPVAATNDFDDYAHNDNPDEFEFEFDEADGQENKDKPLDDDAESQLKEDKNK